MRFSDIIARLVTERRPLMWSVVALVALSSLAILVTCMRLDTEVLNLLPGGFSSVEGLKVYNNEFAQTRELTFALLCEPDDTDKLEEFAPKFAEKLGAQPWCVRVLAGSPMETPEGIRDLQTIAVPLLLNLEPAEFDRAIAILQPQRIQDRLGQLRREIESGSPRPEMELTLDPRWSMASATAQEKPGLVASARTVPDRPAAKKLVLDSSVVVLAPAGRLRNVAAAPTVSASAINVPPCSAPPTVVSAGRCSNSATTRSGVASTNWMPRCSASVPLCAACRSTGHLRAQHRRAARRPQLPAT